MVSLCIKTQLLDLTITICSKDKKHGLNPKNTFLNALTPLISTIKDHLVKKDISWTLCHSFLEREFVQGKPLRYSC